MQATWECESLCFWLGTDAEDLYIWLGEDHPELASAIWRRDLYPAFRKRILAAVQLMGDAEVFVWKEADKKRDTILSAPQEQQLSLLRAEMKNRGNRYRDEVCVYYSENEDEDGGNANVAGPYIDASAVIKSEFSWRGGGPGFGEYASDTVAREALRILRGRQAHHSNTENAPVKSTPSWETDESTPVLSEFRHAFTLQSTCLIVAKEALPPALRDKTVERRCVVVRVDDAWLRYGALLDKPGSLEHRLIATCGRPAPMSVWTLPNNAVWFARDIAIEPIRRFRHEIPVLYVGSKTSRLVLHQFAHWADLYRLHQDWRGAKAYGHLSDPQDLEPRQTELPDGTILFATGRTNLVDIS